ncbi:hypothetical protein C8Q70DRAFT_937815 [Cubamyces menziesii]|nr:hypothetical protein C8Q70DRAFT_937815 [Cubamyces menziesii]
MAEPAPRREEEVCLFSTPPLNEISAFIHVDYGSPRQSAIGSQPFSDLLATFLYRSLDQYNSTTNPSDRAETMSKSNSGPEGAAAGQKQGLLPPRKPAAPPKTTKLQATMNAGDFTMRTPTPNEDSHDAGNVQNPDGLQDENARALASRGNAQTHRMEREVRELFIGYALINVLEPGPVELNWGKYNNRAVDPSHVNSLLIDFQGSDGIDTFRNPFPCIVDEAWIEPESLSKTLENTSRIKTITWTNAARLSRVEVLGGRHRTQALAQYAAILKKKLATERNNLSKAETKAKGAASDKVNDLMAVVSALEDEVRTAGFMAAVFYKRGKVVIRIHGMTSAERLFSWASKAVRKAEETGTTEGPRSPHWSEKVIQSLWNHVERKNNHRLIRILSSPFLYPLVQAIMPFPSMRDGKTVTIKQFNDLLTPTNAGFGQFWAQVLVTKASEMRFIASSVEGWPALNDDNLDDPDRSYKIDTMKKYLGWLQHRRHEFLVRHQKIDINVDNPGRRVASNRLKSMLADYSELIDEFMATAEVEDIWPSSLLDEVDSIYKDVISERWSLLLAPQHAASELCPEETAEDQCEDDQDEDPQQRQIRRAREAKHKERMKRQQEQERFADPRTWEDAVEAYYARVDVAVRREWTRAKQRATGSADKALAASLQDVETRWEWMKTVWMNDPYSVPLPLPTAGFIADLFAQLSEIRQAVKFARHDRLQLPDTNGQPFVSDKSAR